MQDAIHRIRENVLKGLVLNPHGAWVPREELLEQEREIRRHIQNGEVYCENRWLPLAEALASNRGATPIAPSAPIETGAPSSSTSERVASIQPAPAAARPSKPKMASENTRAAASPLGERIEVSSPIASEIRLAVPEIPLCVIKLVGYIDQNKSHELDKLVVELQEKGYVHILFDMEELTFLSSGAWGIMVGHARRLRATRGDLKLCHLPPNIAETYLLLHFDQIVDAHETAEESIAAFRTEHSQTTMVPHTHRQVPALEHQVLPVAPGIDEGYLCGDPAQMPLPFKIKRLIADSGPLSPGQIRRQLNTQTYGNTRAGALRLRRVLKELNLDTAEKRMRFYRSC